MSTFSVRSTLDPTGITATGSFSRIITPSDRQAFGISGRALERAVARTSGREPKDSWTNSPAIAGGVELYSTYNWPEVRTNLTVLDSTITSPNMTQMIASEVAIINNHSTVTVVFPVSLANSCTNSSSTNWFNANSITVGQSVSYDIGLVGGETSLSYERSWGEGGEVTSESSVSLTTGVDVPLGPGQSALVRLLASSGTATAVVRYRATLTGRIASNYNPPHEGHHFRSLLVNDVLRNAGLPTEIIITTNIHIGFFTNAQVIVSDLPSREAIPPPLGGWKIQHAPRTQALVQPPHHHDHPESSQEPVFDIPLAASEEELRKHAGKSH